MNSNMPEIRSIEQIVSGIEDLQKILSNDQIQAFGLPPTNLELNRWIKELKMQHRHSSQRYTIMMLGEFNAGKSTFLNALLGLPKEKRLPAKDEPTNAVPIRLTRRHTSDPEVVWLLADGSQETKTWEEGVGAATQQGKVAGLELEEVKVYIDHPLLYQADIMDMPGTGTAWYKEHTEITENYVSNAELIIWVIGRDEPSRRGLQDYERVQLAKVPLIVLFNAWGFLNPERDALLGIDQDELEEGVRQNFLEPFEKGETFRVYSGKALEKLDSGETTANDVGLLKFRNYLEDKYLGEFLISTQVRRENVLRQINRISRDIDLQLVKGLEHWEDELSRQSLEKAAISNKLHMQGITRNQLRADIRRLAKDKSKKIFSHIVAQAEVFIENYIAVQNFDLWRSWLSNLSNRERLSEDFTRTFRKDYLYLDDQPNWFTEEIQDFVEDAWHILEAYWRTFLLQVATDLPQSKDRINPPHLPFEQFHTSAIAGINDLLLKLLGLGALFTVLLRIPGAEFIDTLILGGGAAKAFLQDPFAKPRAVALSRIRSECEMQVDGLGLELLKYCMEEMNGELESGFLKEIARQEVQVNTKSDNLSKGIQAIDNLRLILDYAIDPDRDKKAAV